MRNILPSNARLVPEHAERVFKGIIYDVYHWRQEMFDGSYETFEMLKRPDTINVLAIKSDKLVILEQEQPDSPLFYDLPGGRHDVETEDELEAAKRELLEETGMIFKTWKLIRVTQPAAKIEHFIYIFVASDFENQIEQNLDAGEKISIKLMALEEVKKLMHDPKARHLPKELLGNANSLEDIINLPEIS